MKEKKQTHQIKIIPRNRYLVTHRVRIKCFSLLFGYCWCGGWHIIGIVTFVIRYVGSEFLVIQCNVKWTRKIFFAILEIAVTIYRRGGSNKQTVSRHKKWPIFSICMECSNSWKILPSRFFFCHALFSTFVNFFGAAANAHR